MELWIRSQDKEVLTKVIDIYKQADTNEIWAYSDRGIKNCLGFYKTKERALEVLDEIQNTINPIMIFKNANVDEETLNLINEKRCCYINNNASLETLDIYVYEMPKE